MIQTESYLEVADNSGARRVMCIKVLGGSKRQRRNGVGDIIKVIVKEAILGKVKSAVMRAAVVRTRAVYVDQMVR